jgi:hypothetical protein
VDELISWPSDFVLLLDLGIVPLLIPTPQQSQDNKNLLEQITSPLVNSAPPKRSNVLMLIGLQSDVGTTGLSDATAYPASQTPSNTAPFTEGTPTNLPLSFEPETTSTPPVTPTVTDNLYQNTQPFDASQLPPASPY